MKSWQEDLLDVVPDKTICENGIFRRIEEAALALGSSMWLMTFGRITPFDEYYSVEAA